MKTLLVPVDFSSMSAKLIRTATELAHTFEGRVVLLHVVMPPQPVTNDFALPVATMQEVMVIDERTSAKRLERSAQKLRDDGLTAEARTAVGAPGPAIIDEARRARANFIVIGSHGHGRLYDLIMGSTASYILKHTTCPVIVLPPPAKK